MVHYRKGKVGELDQLAFHSKRAATRVEYARLEAEKRKLQRTLADPRTRNRLLLEQDPDYAKIVEMRLALLEKKGFLEFPSPAPPQLPSLAGVSSCGGDASSFLERVSSSASSVVWVELQALPSDIDRVLSALKSAGGASVLSDGNGVLAFLCETISLLERASLRSTLSPLLGEASVCGELEAKSRFFESERQKVAAIHEEISELRKSHSSRLREELTHFYVESDVALREKGACCVKHVIKEKGAWGKLKAFALFAFASVSKCVPFSPLRKRMLSRAEIIISKLLDSETDEYDALLAKLEKKRKALEAALSEASALQARATPFARQAAEAAGKMKLDLETVEVQVGKQLAVLRRLKQQMDSGRVTVKTARAAFKEALSSSERAAASAEKIHSVLLGFCEAVGVRSALPGASSALAETTAAVELEAARLAEARRKAAASLAAVEAQVAESQAEVLERKRSLEISHARERAQFHALSLSSRNWLADWQSLKSLCSQVSEAYCLGESGMDSANNLVLAARQSFLFKRGVSADASPEALSACATHLNAALRASGLKLKDARKSAREAEKTIEELSSCSDEARAAQLRAGALECLSQSNEAFSKACHLHSKQAFFDRLFELIPNRAARRGLKFITQLFARSQHLNEFGKRLLADFLEFPAQPITITSSDGRSSVLNKFDFAFMAYVELSKIHASSYLREFARHDWDGIAEHVSKHVGGRRVRKGEPGCDKLPAERKVWAWLRNDAENVLSWHQLSLKYKDSLPPELHARFPNRDKYSRELHYCYAVLHAIAKGIPVARLYDNHSDLQLTASFAVPVNSEFVFHTAFYLGGKPCWATAYIKPLEEFRDAFQVPFPRESAADAQQLAA